jgi:hypothetical protein
MNNKFLCCLLSAALSLVLLSACGKDPAAETDAAGTAVTSDAMAPAEQDAAAAGSSDAVEYSDQGFAADPAFEEMQKKSIARLMEGKWKSTADAAVVVEIADGRFRRYRDNQLQSDAAIELDLTCQRTECQGGKGWCFVELKDSGKQCNLVLQLDIKVLHFKVLSDGVSDEYYMKI